MNIFDAHISGSLSVSGSGEISNDLLILGNLTVLGTISGSISGSITNATNAETASYAPKYTLTSSFNTFTSSYNTGSFSGSFKGDGTNLYNIPASGVTGLNLNKIISGSVSASISPNRGFEVNTDATFTGSVNITGSIYLNGNPIGTGKLDETTFNSYTSSINTYTGNTASTIATLSTTSSVNTLSSSIATTDDNQNTRLGLLETSTGSLNTFTSSTLTRVGVIESTTGSLNTFTSSANGRLTSLESASSSIITNFNSFTSSASGILTSLESASSSIRSDFNSFTSSASDRLMSLETSTGSLNTFTSSLSGAVEVTGSNLTVKGDLLVKGITTTINSTTLTIGDNIIQLNGSGASNAGLAVQDATGTSTVSGSLLWDTSTDYWKAGKLGSEDRIILATEFTDLSSSILSRATSLESASSSIRSDFNSYTSSNNSVESTQNSRLTSIEGVTGSVSSLNIYTGSNNTVIGTLQTSTGSLNTFSGSAISRLDSLETTSGSVNVRLGSLETASGSIRTDFNSYTSSANGRLTSIEEVTGSISSLNIYTGSNNTTNTTQNNRLDSIEGKTGSITSLNTYTGSNDTVVGTLQTSTSSLNSFTSSADGRLTSLESASSSVRTDFNSYTSSNNATNTTQNNRLDSIETSTSSLNTYTSSNNTLIGTIQTATSSLNTFTSSASGRLTSLENKTGSYATTGSNTFVGDQTVSGSLIITQNLTVFGSSSITYVTSSQLRIDDNIITVNTSSPGSRFGGLEVYDSGSINQATGSILWDSVNNRWIYQQSSEATYGGGVLMSGPRSSGSLGSELTLTSGRVAKSAGGDHLNDSNITDNGTTVSINSNTEITGSLIVTNTIVSQTTPLVSGSGQISYTGITNVPSGIVSGSSQILNGSGVWSGSAQLPSGIISGSSQLPSGTVSGSIQVDITSTTNYTTFSSSIATTDSNQNTRLGLLETSTGSLNTFTSSTSGRLTSLESASSSIRSDFNSFTSSNNSVESTQNGRLDSLETTSGSIRSNFNSYTSSNDSTNSTQTSRLNSIEGVTGSIGLLNTYTGSNNTVIGTLQTATSSLNSYTSSNTTNINAIHTATSSLNTFTSSFNTAIGLSSSDVTIKGNLTISGTTTTINSTTVAIGDNIIQLNGTGATNAGLVVRDATAPNTLSGSFLWDTTNDRWIAGTLGSEDDIVLRTTAQTLTNKTISGASNTLSNIGNGSLTNSSITIAGTSTSLGGAISAATILSGTGTISSSIQLPSGIVSSSAQTIANLPSGTVSGSAQVTGIGNAQLTNSSVTVTAGTGMSGGGAVSLGGTVTLTNAGVTSITTNTGLSSNVSATGAVTITNTITNNNQLTNGAGYITSAGTATNVSGIVAVLNGGTGASTAATARTNLGLAIGSDVLAYRTFGTAANSATGDFATYNATTYVGTTAIALNRASASQTLTGVSIDGNAATVTNATFYRQFTVRDDRSDGNDYSLANRPTGLYAITSTGTNGPGSTYSSLIHVANGTDVAFQIAGGYTSDSMYFRGTSALQSGTGYSAWRTVIHSGNIGSQSVSYASTAGALTSMNISQFTNNSAYITGISFANVSSKPTTISGYGITDAITTGNIGSQSVSYASTAGNITAYTINQSVGTGNSPTFVDLYARSHFIQRNANTTHGISWYSSGYTAWCQYMATVNVASTGPTGNITSPAAGNFVTSWALRSFIENVSGYGWTWEAGTSTGQPSIVAEMSSATGNFYTKGSITVGGIFTENSSIRYKTNVETIKYGLDKILQMRGVTYTRKDSGNIEAGVIAEEMYDVTPLVVLKNKDGEVDSVSYGRINAYLIEAVKELKQEINEQNLIITELKGKLGL